MLNYSLEEVVKQIKMVEDEESYYLFKNFIQDEYVPTWREILKPIYDAAADKENEFLRGVINKNLETLVGNLIIIDGIYMNCVNKAGDLNKYFPVIAPIFQQINESLAPDRGIAYYGPKISLGPYFVVPHHDKWNPGMLVCEGSALWTIRNDKNEEYKIKMNRGDFIYVHQTFSHQIEVDEPRAALLFNSRVKKKISD